MKITNKSLLRLFGGLNAFTAKDTKYTMTAIPVTISRFGPSGSLKSKNIALEHKIAVTAKISKGVFFDLKYIGIFMYVYRNPALIVCQYIFIVIF